MSTAIHIVMVLTSCARSPYSWQQTGVWMDDFLTPYYYLQEMGAEITLASPEGGAPPVDPSSISRQEISASMERFRQDRMLRADFFDTLKTSQIDPKDFSGAFYPGGRGALGDLADDPCSMTLIFDLLRCNRPVALLGHAVSALLNVRDETGLPMIRGKRVTCPPDDASGEADGVLSLESAVRRLGARYSMAASDAAYVTQEGPLITGQNSASAGLAAELLFRLAAETDEGSRG